MDGKTIEEAYREYRNSQLAQNVSYEETWWWWKEFSEVHKN